MTQKIPIEFLLKCSRQECGELKSEIDELKYLLNQKDQEIAKLNRKIKTLQNQTKWLKPNLAVNRTLSHILGDVNYIKDPHKVKRERKRLRTYQRCVKYYNAWYDGCKVLYSVLQELRTMSLDSTLR
jgi:septal ring factor EnvC (AmiA/AmiB activator)